jgi:hypothetical protein
MKTIAMREIDLDDDEFSCSYPRIHGPLLESIRRVGVLRPITAVPRGSRYVVVSGYRRALAAHRLGFAAIECMELETVPPFALNLEDNLSTRPLNLFEKALAVKKLGQDPGPYLDLLGVDEANRYLALDRLSDAVKVFALERGFNESTARIFTALEPGMANHAVACARKFSLTASQVRELVEYGREIAERDDLPFSAVLDSVEEAVESEPPAQRRNAFMERLRRERLPDYMETLARIEECLGPLNGTPGVRVIPPPYLEGDACTATLRFSAPEELASQARALLKQSASDALARAFRLLGA